MLFRIPYLGMMFFWCAVHLAGTAASLHAQAFSSSVHDVQIAQQDQADFVEAKTRYRQALAKRDTAEAARAGFDLGELFYETGNFEYALRYYLVTVRLLNNATRSPLLAQAYARLGTVYLYTNDQERSLQSLEAALEAFTARNDSLGMAETWGRMGHYWEKQQDYPRALQLQQKALAFLLPATDSVAIARIYENIGSIYEDRMQLDSASRYFENALGYLQNSGQWFELANLYNNLGDVERKRGRYEQGNLLTRRSLALAQKGGSAYLLKSAYRDLSKSFAARKQADSAYYYLNLAYEAQGGVFSQEAAGQLSQMKALFELEQKDANLRVQKAEISLLESEKRFDKQVQWGLLLAFLVLLGVTIYIIRLQRIRRQSDKVIFEQREAIYEARQQLADRELEHAALTEANLKAELENNRLREAFLNEQLEERSNELTSQTLKIIRKNKLLDELKSKMQAAESTKSLTEIQKLLDQHLRVDKNWENFLDLFEKVHSDFYQKLMARCADLSPAEVRLCCLIRLNIPTKDMAAMLGISNDSLRIARYRLHKKLQLESGERLSAFVLSL